MSPSRLQTTGIVLLFVAFLLAVSLAAEIGDSQAENRYYDSYCERWAKASDPKCP